MIKIFRTLGATCVLAWAVAVVLSTTAVGQQRRTDDRSRNPGGQQGPTEAPAGFDNKTNGFLTQAAFDGVRGTFEEHELVADGLGPVYNADSCASCHANPITGAISQITELRAGHFNGSSFVDQVGGSLINDRAIDPSIQERVLGSSEVLDVPHVAEHARRRVRRGDCRCDARLARRAASRRRCAGS